MLILMFCDLFFFMDSIHRILYTKDVFSNLLKTASSVRL